MEGDGGPLCWTGAASRQDQGVAPAHVVEKGHDARPRLETREGEGVAMRERGSSRSGVVAPWSEMREKEQGRWRSFRVD